MKKKRSLLIVGIIAGCFLGLVMCGLVVWGIFSFFVFETEPVLSEEIVYSGPEVAITSPTGLERYETNQSEIRIGGIFSYKEGVGVALTQNGENINVITSQENWSTELKLIEGDNEIIVKAIDPESGLTEEDRLLIFFREDQLGRDFGTTVGYLEKDSSDVDVVFSVTFYDEPTEGVILYQVDGLGLTNESQRIEPMLDDGSETSGDAVAGDGTYSLKLVMDAPENTLHFRVGNGNKPVQPEFLSNPIELPVYSAPSEDNYDKMHQQSQMIEEEYNRILSVTETEGDPFEDAAAAMEDWLSDQEYLSDSGRSENDSGLWWEFAESKIIGGISAEKEDTLSTATKKLSFLDLLVSKSYAKTSPTVTEVSNFKALYLGPYNKQLGNNDAYNFAFKEIRKSECPKYELTEKKDVDVSVEDFKSLDQYGTVVIYTHGDTWLDGKLGNEKGAAVLHTQHKLTFEEYQKYYKDLRKQRLAARIRGGNMYLTVLPDFISKYNKGMPNSLVFAGACRSAYNNTLAKAFLGAGAEAFYGYTEYVYSEYAYWTSGYMMRGFIHEDMNAMEAFENGIKVRGPHDTNSPPAYFKRYGSRVLLEGDDPCCSGECVSGTYSGMTTIPDTNPQNVGRAVEIFADINIEDSGNVTGEVEIVDPEYEVVLDPENPNPLHLDTRSAEGSGNLTGTWYPEGKIIDYAPSVNGEDVALEVTSGEFYSIELSGTGTYTSNSENSGNLSEDITIEMDGAASKDKIHITVTINGNIVGRLWLNKNE